MTMKPRIRHKPEARADDQQAALEEAFVQAKLPEEDRRDILRRLTLRPGSTIEFLEGQVRVQIAPVVGVTPKYVVGATLSEVLGQLV